MFGHRLYSQWYQRQVKDQFVREARAQDYRSRAAFKLLQIQEAFRVFRPGHRVVDLGAAPGGWSQVSRELVGPRGFVAGIDLLQMTPIDGVEFIKGDFTEMQDSLRERIGQADVVLSDMAPNLTGIGAIDQAASASLNEAVRQFAAGPVLKPNGSLVIKVFQSPQVKLLVNSLGLNFKRVIQHKPEASRKDSAEIYLVALHKK